MLKRVPSWLWCGCGQALLSQKIPLKRKTRTKYSKITCRHKKKVRTCRKKKRNTVLPCGGHDGFAPSWCYFKRETPQKSVLPRFQMTS
jgi:hypothetical protein